MRIDEDTQLYVDLDDNAYRKLREYVDGLVNNGHIYPIPKIVRDWVRLFHGNQANGNLTLFYTTVPLKILQSLLIYKESKECLCKSKSQISQLKP